MVQTLPNVVYLDVARLETVAAQYPEPMREPLMWLGGYIREECRRNLDVLEHEVKQLGFETTASTFSKILRGKWNKDSEGEIIGPVLKQSVFLNIVTRLRQQSQISAMAGKVAFIETDTWNLISNYIDIRRAPDRICKFGLIIGPTGSQKTACYREYCLRNNHGACMWIESPDRPSLSQFLGDLGRCFGCSMQIAPVRRREIIRQSVNSRKTIIVDNIQRQLIDSAGGDQPLFSYLQKMQDETGCTVILSATQDFKHKFTAGQSQGYFEQFEGRCGGASEFLELPERTPIEDILQIAQAFRLRDAEKHAAYLERVSARRGRVRVLFNCLQTARQAAGDKDLTIKHVKAALGEEI
jgi:DNA transposition AAA+ family ATPase